MKRDTQKNTHESKTTTTRRNNGGRLATLFFLLMLPVFSLFSQDVKNERTVDRMMKNCPVEATESVAGLTSFINASFQTEEEKVRAAFVWIAGNIDYDAENIFIDRPENDVWATRKGICQDYADLFVEITTAMGIETYTVQGYTKQQGEIIWQPHTWAAAKIDEIWYFFDPTWAAGYVRDGRFYRKFDDQYFRVLPADFISTHMPFDPFWQILLDPVKPAAFDSGKAPGNRAVNSNFSAELYELNSLDEIAQLRLEIERIEKSKVCNFLLYFVLREKKAFAKAMEQQFFLDKFHEAEYHYEEGVFLLNEFIIYRNKNFEPYEGDIDLKKRIGSVISHLESAQEILGEPGSYPEGINHSASNLLRGIELAFLHVQEHKAFVRLFIETPVSQRPALF